MSEIREILKKYMKVCNCDNDDNWHIDEQDFDNALTQIKELLVKKLPHKKRETEFMEIGGEFTEVCSCAFRAYNQALTDIRKIIVDL